MTVGKIPGCFFEKVRLNLLYTYRGIDFRKQHNAREKL